MRIRQFLLLLLLLAAMPLLAQQISTDEALMSARKFLNSSADGKRRAQAKSQLALAYTSEADGKNTFYVFNSQAQGGGFVIVGADQAAEEILGYCPEGAFDYDNIPDNFRSWLKEYNLQIAHSIKRGAKRASRSLPSWESVSPLITTEWNQDYPFNSEIPNPLGWTGYDAFATGCVATALAQVMNYHKWPEKGVGSAACTTSYIDSSSSTTITFSANFGETTYDWDNMHDTAEVKAIGTLLYHCGVAVNMTYGRIKDGGSSASVSSIPKAISEHFGYDKSARCIFKDSYKDDEWEGILYGQLAKKQPVVYAGVSEGNGGHAFVCDGYRDDAEAAKWHINWGWGGYCDGYYAICGSPALDPNGSGIGGAGADKHYDKTQHMTIDIKPDAGGGYTYSMAWRDYFTLTAGTVERGKDIAFNGSVHNTSPVRITFQIGAKFTDTTTGDTFYVLIPTLSDHTLDAGFYWVGNVLATRPFPTGTIPEGEYTVVPVFRRLDDSSKEPVSQWEELTFAADAPVLTVTAAKGCVITSVPTVGNDEYTTKEAEISFTVKNYGEADEKKEFSADAYHKSGGESQVRFSNSVTIPAGEEISVTLPITYRWTALAPGSEYFFQIDSKNYYFKVVEEKPVSLTMTSAGYGTLIMPYDAELPGGLKAYSCGAIDDTKLVLTESERLHRQTPYLISGVAGTYEWTGPDVPCKDYYQVGMFVGSFGSYRLKPTDYVLQNQYGNLAFYRVGDGDLKDALLPEGRCVLSPTSTNALSFSFPKGEISAISDVQTAGHSPAAGIYDLSGMRLQQLQKGINILRRADGKTIKVLVK